MTVEHECFLALDPRRSRYDRSRFAVIPIPYDATSSYLGGARHGPRAIIEASAHLEDFDEELEGEFTEAGIATLPPVTADARGPEHMVERIAGCARRVVREGKFPLGLGGEHGITAGLVRAVHSRHRKLSVLQIDAHADLRDTYQGSRFSHATVMRRVHEMGVRIVGVGLRIWSKGEAAFMRRNRIEPVTARQCFESEGWLDAVLDRLDEKVYVTVDIDGIDPAYAPGTGTPVPGGLDWYQVTSLLRAVAAEKTLVGADITEVHPLAGQAATEFLAARLAYKIICYAQHAE
ncbi:MAG: agmatinase [Phycisphaerales bacterium]|nr:MAG: agmatinase [Phycisphaerales bacterium]